MIHINYIPDNEISKDDDFINFKLIVLGDSKYKTPIVLRALHSFRGFHNEIYIPTIGFEFIKFHFQVNELKIGLQIWDTCGQEFYRTLLRSFCINSSLAIMIYDVSSKESFDNLDYWYKETLMNTCTIQYFIVGNIDDDSKRVVSTEEGEIYSSSIGAKYFTECSAKTGYSIKNIFFEAAKYLYKSCKEKPCEDLIRRPVSIKINKIEPKKKKKGCF